MPEKNNFLLRLKARNALRGHWQTALLMMMLGSLVSWATQAVSTIQGNTVLQQLMLAMQQVSDTDFITPDFWTDILSKQFGMSRLLANLLSLLAVLVAPMFTLGYIQYFLNLLRGGEEQRWTAVFSCASSWLKGLGLELWMFLKTMAWALPGLAGLFAVMLISVNVQSLSGYGASWLVTLSIVCYVGAIVPSVMAFFRYALSMYYLVDHPDWRIRDCVTASKKAMANQKMNLFFMYISFIGWSLLISLLSNLIFTMFGQVLYLVVNLALNLALSVYQMCSVCAFYDAWRGEDVVGTVV